MNLINGLFKSSLGKKLIMAVTGGAMFLFVVAHLLGNLQIFLPAEYINAYGEFLQSKPELIWPARLGLLALIGLHVWSAVALTEENKKARPQGYLNNPNPVVASYASRTMLMSGLIVGAFILYHLLHFTLQVPAINFTGQDFRGLHDAKHRHDVHAMMVAGFSNPVIALVYVFAIGLLCVHLSHGVAAMFQSLGLKNKVWGPRIDCFAKLAAGAIFVGYASIPLAIVLGLVK